MLSHSTSFGSAHRSQKKLQNRFFKQETPVRAMVSPFDFAWALLKGDGNKQIGEGKEGSSYYWNPIPPSPPPGELELDQPTGYVVQHVMDGYGDMGGRTKKVPIYVSDEGRSDPYRNMDVQGGNQPLSRGPVRSRKRGDPNRQPRFIRPGFRSTESMPLTDKSANQRMR